jgi:hypothetical protein
MRDMSGSDQGRKMPEVSYSTMRDGRKIFKRALTRRLITTMTTPARSPRRKTFFIKERRKE